jgi:sugar phosphate isomerase/epimerase
MPSMLARRDFLQQSAAAAAWLACGSQTAAQPDTPRARYEFCAFTKFLQALPPAELARTVRAAGFAGIEAPVRAGGHFAMDEAADKLPEFAAALRSENVEITLLCTDLLRTDQPGAEACLRTARELGIRRYRMGFYNYDLTKSVVGQLAEIKPAIADIAEMNRELGLQAVYQNHSGANLVGATVWDMFRVLEDVAPTEVALAFDIRHATIEAGLAWPAVFNAVRDHVGAVFVKDFEWRGRTAAHVPLGTGRVDPQFFATLADTNFSGPVSVHVEYLREGDAAANATALQRDLATLRTWLAA